MLSVIAPQGKNADAEKNLLAKERFFDAFVVLLDSSLVLVLAFERLYVPKEPGEFVWSFDMVRETLRTQPQLKRIVFSGTAVVAVLSWFAVIEDEKVLMDDEFAIVARLTRMIAAWQI